jgi:hypothetical protein
MIMTSPPFILDLMILRKLPLVGENEVTEVSPMPATTDSSSSNGAIFKLQNDELKIPGSKAKSESGGERQASEEDTDPLKKKKSAKPSFAEFDDILEQIEEWEDRLETLREYTSRRRERLEEERRAASQGITVEESVKRISKPELNYVSWSTLNERRTIAPIHYAIDIPASEPTPAQLKISPNRRQYTLNPIEEPRSSTLITPESYAKKGELPERIRINSHRLIAVLDFDLWDASLRWNDDSHSGFVILRPFKILVYLEAQIRNRLKEFEQARSNLKQATDEQYLEEFEKTPAQDEPILARQDEASMSLSELTGTINDLRCLTKFMDEIQIPAQMRLCEDPNQVRFADLWYVFPHGSLVIVKDKNIPHRVWKVVQRTGGRRYLSRPENIPRGDYSNKFSPFVLDCYHLDYDGIRYVPSYKQFIINDFDGTQPVNSLPLYPFSVAVKQR